MSHQLLRHISGTLYGRRGVFCVLMYGGPTSTGVIWLVVIPRRGMNSRRHGEQGAGNSQAIQPPLAKKEKKYPRNSRARAQQSFTILRI